MSHVPVPHPPPLVPNKPFLGDIYIYSFIIVEYLFVWSHLVGYKLSEGRYHFLFVFVPFLGGTKYVAQSVSSINT